MTQQRDPDRHGGLGRLVRREDDSIAWAPILLAVSIVVVLGFLLIGGEQETPGQPTTNQRTEIPKTAPTPPTPPAQK
jgi:hypothetical protein